MAEAYELFAEAYVKIMLHCYKFPTKEIGGILIGIADGTEFSITDAFPLFHQPCLATMTEAACNIIEAQCMKRNKKEQIVGYYHVNERVQDKQLSPLAQKLGDKIESICSKACILLVDSESLPLSSMDNLALLLFLKDVKRGWIKVDGKLLPKDSTMTSKLDLALKQKLHNNIYDFDEHLEDITKDWRNTNLYKLLELNV